MLNFRADEINQCYDEYYPLHQAALHDLRFIEKLIHYGAQTTVRTCTQQMTVLHVVFLLGKKSAEDTLATVKMLLQHGLKEHINTPDSLGNTPLHALIVRYVIKKHKIISFALTDIIFIKFKKFICFQFYKTNTQYKIF